VKRNLGLFFGLLIFCFSIVPGYAQGGSLAQRMAEIVEPSRKSQNGNNGLIVLIIGVGIVAIIIIAASNKTWNYSYGKNTIVVKNTSSTCELFINGQLHDKKTSAFSSQMNLQSKLDSGEEVSVHIGGGWFSVDCNLKIDGKFIQCNR